MRKRILWIQTGGTFSCAGTKSGLAPQSSEEQAEKILALMPQVCEKYDIVPMTLMNIDSSDMTISDQKRIADTVNDNIRKYDGIVITHGTDTMAYTAAAYRS
ncbi:Asparaginase/glutaminase, partial [human gut metagenome]